MEEKEEVSVSLVPSFWARLLGKRIQKWSVKVPKGKSFRVTWTLENGLQLEEKDEKERAQ